MEKSDMVKKAEERLVNMRAQAEQLVAQLNMVNGAIQDAEYWLQELKGEVEDSA